MIVSCPACATRFSLDASLLGPNGRNVRCAKCGHRWHQQPPAPVESLAAEVAASEPAAPAAPEPAPPAQNMAPGLAALLGGQAAATPRPAAVVVPPKLKPAAPARKVGMWPWVLLAGIVCGLAVAAYFYQEPISRMVPGADSIYALLGLGGESPADVLAVGNVKTEQRDRLLSVRGDIFNPGEKPLGIPPLMLSAFDSDGKQVGAPFMFRTQETEIAPGETITFRILYENAPTGMKTIRVTFGKIDAKEP
ncbi:MAG TPA: zinc-ribbon domain-containing protein [Dongiaceae bacterium]|nr:zinc-ribbon domain-containing protein [Dongiaceae bacterium]